MAELGDRFWSKVGKTSECWLWRSATTQAGYAVFTLDGRTRYAHRLAYEALVGSIPDGLQLDHLCRVRCCVNPDHLEPVTNRENVMRGLVPIVNRNNQHARKTHCPQGHVYDEANTYITSRGHRQCRTCKSERQQRATL